MANRNIQPGAGIGLTNVDTGKFAKAVSGAADLEWIFPVADLDNIDIEVLTTGTLTGAFTLEISSSYRVSLGVNTAPTVINAGTWTDVTANGLTKVPFVTRYGTDPAAGTSTNRFVMFQCPSQFVKLKWNWADTGTGTISGYFNGKGF